VSVCLSRVWNCVSSQKKEGGRGRETRTYSLDQRFPPSLPSPPALLDVAHKIGVILNLQQILLIPILVDPLPFSVRDARANERTSACARHRTAPIHPPPGLALRNHKPLLSRRRLPVLVIRQRLRARLPRLRALHPRRRLPLPHPRITTITRSSPHLLPQPTRARTLPRPREQLRSRPAPAPHQHRRGRHRLVARTRPHARRVQRMHHPDALHPQRPVGVQLCPVIVAVRKGRG